MKVLFIPHKARYSNTSVRFRPTSNFNSTLKTMIPDPAHFISLWLNMSGVRDRLHSFERKYDYFNFLELKLKGSGTETQLQTYLQRLE